MNLRRWNHATHRDLGFALSGLILVYSLSGVALNHIDDWNPDFLVLKRNVQLDRPYSRAELTPEVLDGFGRLVGEGHFKIQDFPSATKVKLYYDNATMLVDLASGEGAYERVARRPLFFEANLLHRNSIDGWKWISDAFAVLLIALVITGLFILRGPKGILGRGKWWIGAGMLPPLAALLLFALLQP